MNEPPGIKFKHVCTDFPNLTILTKSAMSGEIQATFCHTSVGNKYLGETVTNFILSEYPEYLKVVSINTECANIHLLIMEVLLHSTFSDL